MTPLLPVIVLFMGQARSPVCTAYPPVIKPGDSSDISCSCPSVSVWRAESGNITPNGTDATFSSLGAPAGTVKIEATCTGTTPATQEVYLTILAPPPPPAPHTQALCSISFADDQKGPARVSNEALACLDEVALSLEHQPDASLALVGESNNTSPKGAVLAAQRAVNAKDYLVREKGIDSSRITVWTRKGTANKVYPYLVPAGASLLDNVLNLQRVDEKKVKPIPRYRHGR
jgi:hypothetical protein